MRGKAAGMYARFCRFGAATIRMETERGLTASNNPVTKKSVPQRCWDEGSTNRQRRTRTARGRSLQIIPTQISREALRLSSGDRRDTQRHKEGEK